MSYQSLQFLLFTAVVLVIYYGPGRKHQRGVLLAAGICFYAYAGIQYLPFLLATMGATYLSAWKIGEIYHAADEAMLACDAAQKKELRTQTKKKAKRWLLPGILVPLILLIVCKYTGFIIGNINAALRLINVSQITMFKMILPLGISFYTFMAYSYVLDVYWKRYQPTKSFLLYAAYLSYFPHIVQGPIDRFNEFESQTESMKRFDSQEVVFGAELVIWGFFKKLVVAERLGMFVDRAIDNWGAYRGFVLIAAIAAYSIQIYADFSGCIDIVTGVSEMFGIKLRKNFNHPYFSRNMAEFWRRWHISLQEWFKDYIYFPVSTSELVRKVKKHFKAKGNKKAQDLFASCFPIFVVWMVTGIWHGAAWRFVVWGLFHATLLIGSKMLEGTFDSVNKRLHIKTESFPWRLWQMLRTFVLCCIGRIFFRASDLTAAMGICKKMLDPRITRYQLLHPELPYLCDKEDLLLIIVVVLVLLIIDIIQERTHIREALAKKHIVFRWFIIFAGLFAVLILGIYGPGFDGSSFIYEQF